MPLPPRSVRVSGYHVRRSSASPSLVYVDDVRAEMALLPHSAPTASASTSGVKLAQIVRRASPASSRPSTPMREREIREVREVPLATLIEAHSGKGRPPRSGTAAGLGYDVVPRPEVVALDDKDASTDTPRVPSMPTPSEAREGRKPSPSRSPRAQRSPRLVPTTGSTTGSNTGSNTGTTPPLDSASASCSAGTSVTSTISGSPRRFWSWGEPVTPRLEATEDEEWEYVDVEDGMVGELELEVVKDVASGLGQGLAYAEVVRQ